MCNVNIQIHVCIVKQKVPLSPPSPSCGATFQTGHVNRTTETRNPTRLDVKCHEEDLPLFIRVRTTPSVTSDGPIGEIAFPVYKERSSK
jgi:hypothetical protein